MADGSVTYVWCFSHGRMHFFSPTVEHPDGAWCTAFWVPLAGDTEEAALADKEARFADALFDHQLGPEPRYEVSCLPEDLSDAWAGNFTVTVEYRGDGLWSVSQGEHRKLGVDGTWSWGYRWQGGNREPVTDEERDDYERGRQEWLAAHRFDEATALRLAREAAPSIRLRDFTVADALASAASEG